VKEEEGIGFDRNLKNEKRNQHVSLIDIEMEENVPIERESLNKPKRSKK